MPIVFISYSHDSDAHRQWVTALAQRLRQDGIDVRLDAFLNGAPPETWQRWMLDQLDAATFVLVVCTSTYYRRFRGHEEIDRGHGVDFEGLLITQEIYQARSKTLKFVPVLASLGDRGWIPEPLRGWNVYSVLDDAGYQALYDFLLGQAGIEPAPLGESRIRLRQQIEPLTFGGQPTVPSNQKISPSRLPSGPATLFGRDAELTKLDAAWRDPRVKVVTLVAWGGVGKTSLVSTWMAGLAERGFDGADYFDWSFYSQGTRDHATASADPFVDAALRFFGDEATADSTKGPWDKGARLAELVARRRTLLVLDGLEPLQYPPGPLAGELRDPALKALLRGLVTRNAGLCVLTTRESVVELEAQRAAAPEWRLDHLPLPAGVELLRSLGVVGTKQELGAAVREVEGHALTLNLVGRYLAVAHGGDVRKRDRVDLAEADRRTRGKGHAFRAMAAYERWLAAGDEENRRQLAVLRLLGLFDRPARQDLLATLRAAPAIPGLSEPLAGVDEVEWNLLTGALAGAQLLTATAEHIDTHPLIREYFDQQLRQNQPAAWRAAHGRLFDHLAQHTEHRPATLAGLQPLYQAVYHGCQAGRQQAACNEIYRDRILRGTGDDGFYSTKKLGAIGADLGAVACFFETPWRRVDPSLAEPDQAWLLNQAAFRLRALGRLREAVEPMRAGLEMDVLPKYWRQAAISASNLSELELSLGEVRAALADAEQSVSFADRSGDASQRMINRTTLADAQHQAGDSEKALALFLEAERLQAEKQPSYPQLYSLPGFRYCDLLLAPAELAAASGRGDCAPAVEQACAEVERRALEALPIAESNNWLLDVALDHLSLGRARLYRAIAGERATTAAGARAEVEEAVAGLRTAGTLHNLPWGLLTRAWLRQVEGDLEGARADLDEAGEIAERGAMKLHLADVALYRARLFDDRAALAEAKRLVEECGYGRRRAEIALLEERFGSA